MFVRFAEFGKPSEWVKGTAGKYDVGLSGILKSLNLISTSEYPLLYCFSRWPCYIELVAGYGIYTLLCPYSLIQDVMIYNRLPVPPTFTPCNLFQTLLTIAKRKLSTTFIS